MVKKIGVQNILCGDATKAFEALNHPTEGELAVELWEMLSGNHGPFTTKAAAQIYRDCGYIPFSGYPLARSGRIDRMTRQEVEQEFKTNPLLSGFAGE